MLRITNTPLNPHRCSSTLPVMLGSFFCLHCGTKTVISLCPIFQKVSTARAMPRQEKNRCSPCLRRQTPGSDSRGRKLTGTDLTNPRKPKYPHSYPNVIDSTIKSQHPQLPLTLKAPYLSIMQTICSFLYLVSFSMSFVFKLRELCKKFNALLLLPLPLANKVTIKFNSTRNSLTVIITETALLA